MAIVWPCPLAVDAYAAAGAKIDFTQLGKFNAGEPGHEQEQER